MDDTIVHELIQKFLTLLDSVDLSSYYGPICPIDDQIAALCESMSEASPDQRRSFSSSLNEHRKRVLGRYTLRAPVLALRTAAPRYLRAGLVARTLLTDHPRDWRDDLVSFAPYHYVARTLGLAPAAFFAEAAVNAAPIWVDLFQRFGRRTDVTLNVFGWRRVETPDGPTFETLDWHGKPTGAVVGDPSWEFANRALVDRIMIWAKDSRSTSDPP